jgi:hypothetical protein
MKEGRMKGWAAMLAAAFVIASSSISQAEIMFSSDFDGNTGAHVFAGDTDNVAGSSSLGVTWNTVAPGITVSPTLTAISTSSGGFAQTQNGTATYANPNVVYISRNLNLDTNPQRGFSVSFAVVGPTWQLDELVVSARHTNNQGTQAQVFSSDLVYGLTDGGTYNQTGSVNVTYTTSAGYTSTAFPLTGLSLAPGNYTLSVYMTNLTGVGAGAYATYDGVRLVAVPEPGVPIAMSLIASAGLAACYRRRKAKA